MDDWEGNDTDNPQEDKFKQGIEEEKVCQLGKNSLWWWFGVFFVLFCCCCCMMLPLLGLNPLFHFLKMTFWKVGGLFLPSACLLVLPLSFY